MLGAIDAIFEPVAPVSRPGESAPPPGDGPSFKERLDAVSQGAGEQADPAEPDQPPNADASASAAAPPATPPQVLPQPALLQILSSLDLATAANALSPEQGQAPAQSELATPPPGMPSAAKSAKDIAPSAPAQAAAPAPGASSEQTPAPVQPPAAQEAEPIPAPAQDTPSAHRRQADATEQNAPAQSAHADATADAPQPAPAITVVALIAPVKPAPAEIAAAPASMIAPGNTNAQTSAPMEAAPTETAVPPITAKQNAGAKTAMPQGASQNGAKDFAALLAPLLAADTSAQTPQVQPTAAGLGDVTAAASSHATLEAAARAAPVAAQVGREIVRRFNGESTRFELRLDPPELGRVEVRLEVSRDHRVTAIVAADSPQALSDLARNARELEQALNQAGLELSDNGLSFDLSSHREGFADAEDAAGRTRADANAETNETPNETQRTARPIGLERWRGVRVDLVA